MDRQFGSIQFLLLTFNWLCNIQEKYLASISGPSWRPWKILIPLPGSLWAEYCSQPKAEPFSANFFDPSSRFQKAALCILSQVAESRSRTFQGCQLRLETKANFSCILPKAISRIQLNFQSIKPKPKASFMLTLTNQTKADAKFFKVVQISRKKKPHISAAIHCLWKWT